MKNRLLSLDVLRGITIAGMLLVNNPGTWGSIYAPLRHAEWNGLTPTDLVFPFFMFIMGMSAYFSLRKYDFRLTASSAWKVVRRACVILLIGWGICWLSLFLRRVTNPEYTTLEAIFNFGNIRTLGVLPRLAICYGVTALLALTLKRKWLIRLTALMLIAYAVTLVLGRGYEFSDANVISIVDHKVLGTNHMYSDTIDGVTLKFDPEGLLSTLPSIAHCLIGLLCGGMIMSNKNNERRSYQLFIVGASLMLAGWLLSYAFPINKKIWSPTFVLVTCGMASSLLALLIWIIDIKGRKRWCRFFEVFGINPLFLYTFGTLLSIAFSYVKLPSADGGLASIHTLLYRDLLVPMCLDNTMLASLCYAVVFVCLNWCVGLILYKKKIYIKI